MRMALSVVAWMYSEAKKTGDYHEEMDGNRFEGWFNDVLPKLPAVSVIVIDNAPYYTR